MIYVIDIVGTCNLACPSCPVGNYQKDEFLSKARPRGMMDFALFKEIVEKIKRESDQPNPTIELYNWGESFLHPQIEEFIRHCVDNNVTIHLSTNFNCDIDIKKIVSARPSALRISFSGFYQETYEKSHRKGDINIVKSNLYRFRYYMDRLNINIPTQMYYHVYRDNLGKDILMALNLAQELKLPFVPGWAYFMPLEKIMRYLNGKPLSDDEQQVVQRLLLSIETQVEIAKKVISSDCLLRQIQTVINHDGSVALCCAVYDPQNNISDTFLDKTKEELQALKYAHPLCKQCMAQSLPSLILANPVDEWDRLCNIELRALGFPHVIMANKRLC